MLFWKPKPAGEKWAYRQLVDPQLEFLQSVVSSIRANGVPLQWSADITEHSHITFIKEPVSHTNNQRYEPQICRYLDRHDKVDLFDLATHIEGAGVELRDEDDLDESGDEEDDGPILVSTTLTLLEHAQPPAHLWRQPAVGKTITPCQAVAGRPDPKGSDPFRTFTSTRRMWRFISQETQLDRNYPSTTQARHFISRI
ncbi:hypothetical protein B0H17DRAFT_1138364 [Mycena rosella]|uniref:Uncharacterized protein n=1 Tax=Mycena rosella TaxID=1033263 RepID=A0AAD7GDQ1_MYCRO|nr:hypothetical protein B0H17DRAFT_1138364 [Mycena rosella]